MFSVIREGVEYRPFDHLYQVSACGQVLRKCLPVNLCHRKDGYFNVGRQRLLHRMVATCWVDGYAPGKMVHHIDGNKGNNSASNLEWVSAKEHVSDKHKDIIGRQPMSESAREKLRQYRLGKVTSEETKAKQRAYNIRTGHRPPPPWGRVMSEANRKECGKSQRVACEVHGVRYESFTQAATALGERPLSLRKRCLSKNFTAYKITTT